MIHVIAEIELVAGSRDQFLTHFLANVPHVLAEQGCLEYAPTIDLATEFAAQPRARDHVVTVIEKWDSLAALQAHMVAPHMATYRENVKGLVVETILRVMQPA